MVLPDYEVANYRRHRCTKWQYDRSRFGSLEFITWGSRGRYESEAIFRVHWCSHSPARQVAKPGTSAFTSQSEISPISTHSFRSFRVKTHRLQFLSSLPSNPRDLGQKGPTKGVRLLTPRSTFGLIVSTTKSAYRDGVYFGWLRKRPFPFVRPSPDYLFLLRAFESRVFTGKLHRLLSQRPLLLFPYTPMWIDIT